MEKSTSLPKRSLLSDKIAACVHAPPSGTDCDSQRSNTTDPQRKPALHDVGSIHAVREHEGLDAKHQAEPEAPGSDHEFRGHATTVHPFHREPCIAQRIETASHDGTDHHQADHGRANALRDPI